MFSSGRAQLRGCSVAILPAWTCLTAPVAKPCGDASPNSKPNSNGSATTSTSNAGKRQAAPFRNGPPKPDPKRPGRKAGDQHGTHGHRPPHVAMSGIGRDAAGQPAGLL
jgi:hypothetical protein